MRGRPQREPSGNLCIEFESVRSSAGLSRADAAKLLLVDPSTLSRSLKNEAFSKDVQVKVRRFIQDYAGASPSEARTRSDLEGALHILRKLEVLSPHLQDAIKIALDAARKPE